MITLNHIGIATKSGDDQLQKLFKILDFKKGTTESVADQGVQVCFYALSGNAPHLETLEVEDPDGTVAKFIQKRGPGVHHLSFQVPSGRLDSLTDELAQAGFKFTYDAPRRGAQNMRINFIHPSTAGGVLIELMEESR